MNKLPSITLTGDIDQTSLADFCNKITLLEVDGCKKARIDITSNGGCLESGIAMAARMRLSPITFTTFGLSMVASSALLVFAAGDMRACSKYCTFTYHEILVEIPQMNIRDLVDQSNLAVLQNERLHAIMADLTGIPIQSYKNLITGSKDFNFDARFALDFGLISRIY
jgi:ATP-dependent protease ClpP protease subunit